jgi:uncharacterized protein YdaU (DUF1376 family)
MPLDVHQFLIGTMHLNTTLVGAYTLLSSYYWWNGPLPNNDKFLASVARMDTDTWSTQEAAIRGFFEPGADGRLRMPEIDLRRGEHAAKQQKRSEKARAAVNVRWRKWRERNLSENAHTVSTTRVQPSTNAAKNAQIKNEKEIPPAPLLEKAKIKSRNGPCTPPNGGLKNSPPEHLARTHRPHSHRRPAAGSAIRPGRELRRVGKSVENAKMTRKPVLAAFRGRDGGNHDPGRRNRVAGPAAAITGHSGSEHQSKKAGGSSNRREVEFKNEIFEYWKSLNPSLGKCPWRRADENALKELLRICPEMARSEFRRLLINRAQSAVPESAPVHRWLRDVYGYASGPLNEFNRKMRPPRQY